MTQTLFHSIAALLQDWDSQGRPPVADFLAGRLEAGTVAELTQAAGEIASNYASVRAARGEGVMPQRWLSERIGPAAESIRDATVLGATAGFNNTELAGHLLDLGRGFAEQLGEHSVDVSGVGALVEASVGAQQYFASELGGDSEPGFVALVAGAAYSFVAGTEGDMPTDVLVGVVDNGLFTAKVGYKVSIGEISVDDGVELVSDRVAATVAALAARAVAKGFELGGMALGTALGVKYFQNARLGAEIGRSVGRMAGEAMAGLVEAGVRRVVKTATAFVTTGARKLLSKVFG